MNIDMEIEKKVKEVLSDKADYPIEEIEMNSSLTDDLGVDSFAVIEIMFALDSEFGVKVNQEEITELKTVSDVVGKVKELLKERK